jgi:hypothetical protein
MTYIIGISGKKQSGKSSLCSYLQACHWANWNNNLSCLEKDIYTIEQNNDGIVYTSEWDKDRIEWTGGYGAPYSGIKILSFADPLKKFCIDVLGLRHEQCYGTDDDKNSLTEYKWENLYKEIREKYKFDSDEKLLRSGKMTARDVMQIFGSDICRNMFSQNIWVTAALRSAYDTELDNIVFISDVRFPSEVSAIAEYGGSVIRLTRNKFKQDSHMSETALDNFDWEYFKKSGGKLHIIDNNELSIQEKNYLAIECFEKILKEHSEVIQ